jgi:hypothetical protein
VESVEREGIAACMRLNAKLREQRDALLYALKEAVEQLESNFITVPDSWTEAIRRAEER